jgi:WD40 repeat protein
VLSRQIGSGVVGALRRLGLPFIEWRRRRRLEDSDRQAAISSGLWNPFDSPAWEHGSGVQGSHPAVQARTSAGDQVSASQADSRLSQEKLARPANGSSSAAGLPESIRSREEGAVFLLDRELDNLTGGFPLSREESEALVGRFEELLQRSLQSQVEKSVSDLQEAGREVFRSSIEKRHESVKTEVEEEFALGSNGQIPEPRQEEASRSFEVVDGHPPTSFVMKIAPAIEARLEGSLRNAVSEIIDGFDDCVQVQTDDACRSAAQKVANSISVARGEAAAVIEKARTNTQPVNGQAQDELPEGPFSDPAAQELQRKSNALPGNLRPQDGTDGLGEKDIDEALDQIHRTNEELLEQSRKQLHQLADAHLKAAMETLSTFHKRLAEQTGRQVLGHGETCSASFAGTGASSNSASNGQPSHYPWGFASQILGTPERSSGDPEVGCTKERGAGGEPFPLTPPVVPGANEDHKPDVQPPSDSSQRWGGLPTLGERSVFLREQPGGDSIPEITPFRKKERNLFQPPSGKTIAALWVVAGIATLCCLSLLHYLQQPAQRPVNAPSATAPPPRSAPETPGGPATSRGPETSNTVEAPTGRIPDNSTRAEAPRAASLASLPKVQEQRSSGTGFPSARDLPREQQKALAFGSSLTGSVGRAAMHPAPEAADLDHPGTLAGPPSLVVEKAPPGAQIFVDDRLSASIDPAGQAKISTLAPGRHRLRVSFEGYQDYNQDIDLSAGQAATLTARLERSLPVLPGSAKAPKLEIAAGLPAVIRSLDTAGPGFVLDRTLKGHSNWVTAVAFSPDGRRLASGSWDRTVKFWEVPTGRELATIGKDIKGVQALAFSGDGRWLAAESSDNSVTLWDAATRREVRTLAGNSPLGLSGNNWVYSIAFSPDGRWLASGVDNNTVRLWDVNTGRTVRDLAGPRSSVTYIAFSPDGRWLASGAGGKAVKIWEASTGRVVRTLSAHKKEVYSVAFSPDSHWLASASGDKTIKLWDLATGHEIHTLTGHRNSVTTLAFSSNGRWLASGSWDNTVKIWDVETGRELQTLTGHAHHVYTVAFDSRGRWLASGSEDGGINIWRLKSFWER